MPCISFPIDIVVGPVLEIGISSPLSLATHGAPPPQIHWFKALADTGCSHTSIHSDVAAKAGLTVISKALVKSTTHSVAVDVYLGDLFLRVTMGTRVFEFPFRDRSFAQLLNASPSFDALLGMDIFSYGTLVINGDLRQATFCW